ncbi:MAG: ChbG/HpnK family deacetylase [Rhizomicrobium sp.]
MAYKRIVLCADDYGLSPGVSRAIRELLDAGRLTATSCMTVYPEFEIDGPMLAPWIGKADLGLHFTLTADRPVSTVMRQAYLGRLNQVALEAELQLQLDRFRTVLGRPPDYIDGHQHVHLYPGIRELVVRAAQRMGIYVRSTHDPINFAMAWRPSPVESAFLAWSARPLERLISRAGLRTNRGFRGARTFRETVPYRLLFRRIIAGATDCSIVMCHPGHADSVLVSRDGVTHAREEEFSYLAGGEFQDDIAHAGLTLSRFVGAD